MLVKRRTRRVVVIVMLLTARSLSLLRKSVNHRVRSQSAQRAINIINVSVATVNRVNRRRSIPHLAMPLSPMISVRKIRTTAVTSCAFIAARIVAIMRRSGLRSTPVKIARLVILALAPVAITAMMIVTRLSAIRSITNMRVHLVKALVIRRTIRSVNIARSARNATNVRRRKLVALRSRAVPPLPQVPALRGPAHRRHRLAALILLGQVLAVLRVPRLHARARGLALLALLRAPVAGLRARRAVVHRAPLVHGAAARSMVNTIARNAVRFLSTSKC